LVTILPDLTDMETAMKERKKEIQIDKLVDE
jgi:hypothetical protein